MDFRSERSPRKAFSKCRRRRRLKQMYLKIVSKDLSQRNFNMHLGDRPPPILLGPFVLDQRMQSLIFGNEGHDRENRATENAAK